MLLATSVDLVVTIGVNMAAAGLAVERHMATVVGSESCLELASGDGVRVWFGAGVTHDGEEG